MIKAVLPLAVLGAAMYVQRCEKPPGVQQPAPASTVDSTYYHAQRAWSGTPPRPAPDTSCQHAVGGGNLATAPHGE
jgi:hypothetical protein